MAVGYDTLVLIATLFLATALVLPCTGGEAIAPYNPLYDIYLVFVCVVFFVGFWTHGGQTVGMKAWRVRVQCANGDPIGVRQAAVRFVVAIASWSLLGLGFWWSLLDGDRQTWHDRASRSRLVVIPRKVS